MKFSTREDIQAPMDAVYQAITDFPNFERMAKWRGAKIERLDGDGPVKQGASWDVSFSFRNKERHMRGDLVWLDDQGMKLESASVGLTGVTIVDLVPLSPARTRLAVSIELRAKSLSARLLLQSLKLAKSRLNNKFKARVSEFAEELESQHRRRG